ncbi:PEP-CTERM/exosortase system-associated acyltransferase [Denitrobaculum tricleocarpae]|uniref:PEP-CTERM/exosortase system-associated acyltransferase n=1 Tax=Denitrobaculum tricleocarpae TaxID=2591009 RepID=UPI0015D37DBF|nr:PEP-CTERM/exosortase system-associated acyltransferase [Denitrobaculum tricleocarpae]
MELFNYWFEAKSAKTSEAIEQAFRLRYQVYCVENDFEDPEEHPSGLEIDAFDAHSVHSLLIHRPSQTTVGAVRLVLPLREMAHCLPIHDLVETEALPFPVATSAEISRYAISREFRRRSGEERYADINWHELESKQQFSNRRIMPHITLGLMQNVLRMAIEHGVSHLCAVMEPALIRLLSRFGLNFHSLGPIVNYHGMRQPCFASLDELLLSSRLKRQEFWQVGTNDGKLVAAC